MQSDRTFHLLVIAPDPSLAGEVQEVLNELKDYRCVLTFEGNELRFHLKPFEVRTLLVEV